MRTGFLCLTTAAFCALTPFPAWSQDTPAPSPTRASQPQVESLSAQRAEVERGKIYGAGVAYSRWIDNLAQNHGNTWLQKPVFDRVTRMRLLASIATLLLIGLVTSVFLWIVRKGAGRIESDEPQSLLALAAAAVRKPLALLAWVVGGFLAFMPIVDGIASAATRQACANGLTAILYAGRVIAVLWLIFQVIRGLEKQMRHWAQRTGSVLNNVLVPVVGQTLRLAVPLLALTLLLPLLSLPERWTWVAQKVFGILLVVSLSYLIIRGVRAVQAALMREHRIDVADNLAARRIYTQVSVIRKIIIAGVIILGTASILMLFDRVRQLGTSILASAGIAGIILGFAAQKTLGNLLAGIQIALSQPILIDDVVLVEGEFGRIEDITLTFVSIRTWDLRRLVVPITYFIEKPFQNWSRKSDEILGTIFLHLDYQVPLGELREELMRLVEKNENWDRNVCSCRSPTPSQTRLKFARSSAARMRERTSISAARCGKVWSSFCAAVTPRVCPGCGWNFGGSTRPQRRKQRTPEQWTGKSTSAEPPHRAWRRKNPSRPLRAPRRRRRVANFPVQT